MASSLARYDLIRAAADAVVAASHDTRRRQRQLVGVVSTHYREPGVAAAGLDVVDAYARQVTTLLAFVRRPPPLRWR